MDPKRKVIAHRDRAFNVWLDLVDQLLERRIPLAKAMFYAGEKLQEEQEKSRGERFHSGDLFVATQDINILLRRTPDFKGRTAGWAKESLRQHS